MKIGNKIGEFLQLRKAYRDLSRLDDSALKDQEDNQKITVKQGIEQPVAKNLVASLKEAKLKVEAQINGDKLRVTGKKRDDLQLAMQVLRKAEVELPLQFDNFRD